ncbi:PREDICTED: splicing regulatory glutamine/lysine-rich protein 1-like [Branchiostoma belcheri]|uniref:Splicing regulatory glutamine/lysine-rich protein 1-like n=1 Tax=Branchiostoma belcheri TaxID=7741 RepID=A0A6P4Y0C4_BRABE|nr:PREDICTED: splicing regulatory glutamine/lysine-rich protein 1-like [Branchiostoma belcheri]
MGVETGTDPDGHGSLSRKTPSASQGSILKRDPSSKTVRTRGSSTPKKSVSFDPTPEVFFVPSRCESRTENNPGARVSPQSPTDVSTYLLHYQGSNYERTKSLKWDSGGTSHNVVTQPPGLSIAGPTGIHAELYSVAASLSNLVPRRRLRDLLVNTEDLQEKMKKFQEDTDDTSTGEGTGKDAKGGDSKKPEPARTIPLAKPTRQIKPFRINITSKYSQQTEIRRPAAPVIVDLKPKRKPKNFEEQPSVFKRLYLHSHPNEAGPPKEEVKIPEIPSKKSTRPITAKSSRSDRNLAAPPIRSRDRDRDRDKEKHHHHHHHHHHHKDKDKDRHRDADKERERQKARERLYGTASRGNSRPKAAKPTPDRPPPRPPPTTPPARASRRPPSRSANVPVAPQQPAQPKPVERTRPPPDDRARLFPRTALEKFVMAELQRSRISHMVPSAAGQSNRGSPKEELSRTARPTPAFKLPDSGVRHIGYASTRERKVSWRTGEVETIETGSSKHTPIMKRFSIAFRSPVKV